MPFRKSLLLVAQDLRLHVGAELSGAQNDGSANRQAFGLEASERLRQIVWVGFDRVDERGGVAGRLGHAHPHMRASDESRVADDRRAQTENHAVRLEILNGLYERLIRFP